jgi:hypothetical protein
MTHLAIWEDDHATWGAHVTDDEYPDAAHPRVDHMRGLVEALQPVASHPAVISIGSSWASPR